MICQLSPDRRVSRRAMGRGLGTPTRWPRTRANGATAARPLRGPQSSRKYTGDPDSGIVFLVAEAIDTRRSAFGRLSEGAASRNGLVLELLARLAAADREALEGVLFEGVAELSKSFDEISQRGPEPAPRRPAWCGPWRRREAAAMPPRRLGRAMFGRNIRQLFLFDKTSVVLARDRRRSQDFKLPGQVPKCSRDCLAKTI